MTDEQQPRLTPTQRLHEVTMQALTRPAPASARPKFAVRQVKGVGGATVIEWDVEVPVCDEYPTAGDAHHAALNFADGFARWHGNNPDLEAKLAESVRVVKDTDKQARAAAAIAAAIARSQAKR